MSERRKDGKIYGVGDRRDRRERERKRETEREGGGREVETQTETERERDEPTKPFTCSAESGKASNKILTVSSSPFSAAWCIGRFSS